MAAGGGEPPGGQRKSWADVLGSSLPPTWNKNILEVISDKDERGPFIVNQEDCAKVMNQIGLNIASQVEAVQICPNGRGVINITLKSHVLPENFMTFDILEVSGKVRTVNVNPTGKREITFNVRGFHSNTQNQCVIGYFSKFRK